LVASVALLLVWVNSKPDFGTDTTMQPPAPQAPPPIASVDKEDVASEPEDQDQDSGPPPVLPQLKSIPAGRISVATGDHQEVTVDVPAFRMAATEVTVADFRQFVEQTHYSNPLWNNYPCESSGGRFPTWESPGYPQPDQYPVVCVSQADARAYVSWLSRRTGRKFSLPDVAQWEWAARAGARTAYWWGNSFDESKATCSICAPFRSAPLAVASYPANPWGLFDVSGNVREWTCTEMDSTSVQCTKMGTSTRFVVKGGSWFQKQPALALAALEGFEGARRNVWTGFRITEQR